MCKSARNPEGFTLIELLVVIAVIAILAALLFPVFGRAREATRKTSCMSQMHEIDVAFKQYRLDFNKYPSVLMCYPYIAGNPQLPYVGSGTPIPAGGVRNRPLGIKKYLKDIGDYQCPDNPVNNQATVLKGVVFPPGVPIASNSATAQALANTYYYKFDSYDTGPQISAAGEAAPGVTELHYALDWTGVVSAADAHNQLKYPDPDENTTVVTWCTYHVAIAHGDQVPILLLNGSTRSLPYKQMVYQSASATQWPLNYAP